MIRFPYSPPEADQPWAGIFHIPYSAASPKPSGYALLLSVMILSFMLAIGILVTNLIMTQLRLATRAVDTMRALAAADSGIEMGLYNEFKGQTATTASPFDVTPYSLTVQPTGGAPAGLRLAYSFEDVTGTTVADLSGASPPADGTLQNGATVGSGKYGQGVVFDGVDDYVSASIDVSEDTYTAAFWFKTTCGDCGLYLVVNPPSAPPTGGFDRGIRLQGSKLCARLYSEQTICTTSATNYADNQWHYVAHVYGEVGGHQKVYVDGALADVNLPNDKNQSDFFWQTGIVIGYDDFANQDFLLGSIDNVRIYNRALSAGEILDDMNTAVGASTSATTIKSIGAYKTSQRSVEVSF